MAELSYAWWKKHKPKTLLKEPMSGALKEFDQANGDRIKIGNAEHFHNTLKALSNVEKAAEDTKKKCNKVLHKDAIGYCDDLGKLAATEKKYIADHRKKMSAWCSNVAKAIGDMDTAWKNVESDPSKDSFAAYAKAVDKANKILVMQDQPYPSVGEYFGAIGGEVFKATEMQKEEAIAAGNVAESAKGGDEKAQKKLTAMMSAMKGTLNNCAKNVKKMAADV